jgi:two-component system cell cycle response regulator DivK
VDGDGRGVAASANGERMPIQPKDATVLVMEDNVSNFVLIARMLAYMGVPRCEWKTSGWQVVEYADILPRVDLILMDLRLPYEDGYTALQMAKARESGFDGFLGKPLDPDRFPEQIRRLLHGDAVWEIA